jgi:hypothetical protein
MRIRQALTAAVVALALVLVACAGPSATSRQHSSGVSAGSAAESTTANPPNGLTTPSNMLTPVDVEKVSGLSGVKVVPYDPSKGAGGQINLATSKGKLVVMATFGDGLGYASMKSSMNYRQPLSGLGDAAFIGPSKEVMPTLYIVGFKKGDHSAVLTTYFSGSPSKTMLSMSQLKELAAIVASRW